MKQKYRLKIPEMIRKDHAAIAYCLRLNETIEVIDGVIDNSAIKFIDIPNAWLDLIEDEPVSAEELISNTVTEIELLFGRTHGFRSEIRDVIQKVIDNERLWHRPQQTRHECWLNNKLTMVNDISTEGAFKTGWQAHAKATNTEP